MDHNTIINHNDNYIPASQTQASQIVNIKNNQHSHTAYKTGTGIRPQTVKNHKHNTHHMHTEGTLRGRISVIIQS